MKPAFRLLISSTDSSEGYLAAFSGVGLIAGAPKIDCPNCRLTMFPALNFYTAAFDLRGLFGCDFVTILFCPSCGHHLKPYWIRQRVVDIVGGYFDNGQILVNVDRPFAAREIELRVISDSIYSDSARNAYLSRSAEDGVYHQIGGPALRGRDLAMSCCDCDKAMTFAGMLDSDDLNIPLYENGGVPLALNIADNGCLNIYSCSECGVIGLRVAL